LLPKTERLRTPAILKAAKRYPLFCKKDDVVNPQEFLNMDKIEIKAVKENLFNNVRVIIFTFIILPFFLSKLFRFTYIEYIFIKTTDLLVFYFYYD
jgi:hypothetical protein